MIQDIVRRNNVRLIGRGTQPLMMAHGFGCDQNMWRFVAPAFEDEYKVILFDYVGAGKSDLTAYDAERYGSLNGYAQDVLDICEALNLNDVIFVGHSVSSMIGILAAIQKPQHFDRMILVGPSPCYINDPPHYVGGFNRDDLEGLLDMMDKNYLSWANFLAPAVMKNPEHPALTEELQASFCNIDPAIAQQFARATFFADNRRDLPHMPVPSLILQCSDDTIAPREVGDYLHHHLPNSTLRVMEATGHCPHMSHPEETIRLIKEYLAASGKG